nr:hemagglutinin repeat-containing protein [Duganella violaceicalia]
MQAGGDVLNQSLTVKQEYASVNTSGSYTTLSNQASITAGGALAIKAGRDVTDTGGTIAGASVGMVAGRDVNFNALQTGSAYASQVAGFTEKDSATTYKTGQVASGGDLKLVAGQDIKLSGTQVAIGAAGNGTLLAGRDVTVSAVVNEVNISKQNDPGSKLYDKEIRQNQSVVGASASGDVVTQVGSLLSGGSVSASSGRDTVIRGSTVVADKDIRALLIMAGRRCLPERHGWEYHTFFNGRCHDENCELPFGINGASAGAGHLEHGRGIRPQER